MRLLRRPYRISVMRQLGGVGDMLMLTSVFRGLKEKYGHCRVTVATSWDYHSGALPLLLKGNPFVDEVVRVEPREFVTSALRQYRGEYKDVPNDHIPVCVQDTDLVIDLNCICSIVESRTQPNVTEHRTDIWCRTAGVEPSCKRPILVLTEEERAEGAWWADKHLGDGVRVGVVLQAHCIERTWPHAGDLAWMLHTSGYRVCTIDATRKVNDRIPALIGRNIRQVAAAMEHLDAVVTPDSGLLHLAGTVGTPVLGIFGSTNGDLRMREYAGHYVEARRLMPCAPCWYTYPCRKEKDAEKHFACMKIISPQLVRCELDRMLNRFEALRCPLPCGFSTPMAAR